MIRQLFILFFVALSLPAFTQVDLQYQLGKDSIFIGDQVALRVAVTLDPDVEITALDLSLWDSIPVLLDVDALMRGDTNPAPRVAGEDFEIVDYGRWNVKTNVQRALAKDLQWQAEPNNTLVNTIKFTLWKEGVFALPPLRIYYQQNGQERIAQAKQAMAITVFSPLFSLKQPVDSLELAEVKPILEEAATWEDYLLHIVSVLVFLLVFILGYFYLNRKVKDERLPDPPVTLTAHEYALQALKELEGKKLWQQGEVKAYQSELTYILRNYLEHRYDIPALESTTDELFRKLKTENFSLVQKEQLREILQVADLVKFAKAKPAVDINTKVMQSAENFVRETKSEAVMVAVHKDGLVSKVKEETEETAPINPLDRQENLASVSERSLAQFIDLACVILLSYLSWWSIGGFNSAAAGWSIYLLGASMTAGIFIFYSPLLEANLGASLGKLFTGLAIRTLDNTNIGLGKAFERLSYKTKNFGLLLGLLGKGRQDRILDHDQITATRVVKKAKI